MSKNPRQNAGLLFVGWLIGFCTNTCCCHHHTSEEPSPPGVGRTLDSRSILCLVQTSGQLLMSGPLKAQEFLSVGVTQRIEIGIAQRIAGSIPSQGTCLGCRLGPQ